MSIKKNPIMETAKQIADLYFPDNQKLANDLERDILKYLEYHLKKHEQRKNDNLFFGIASKNNPS